MSMMETARSQKAQEQYRRMAAKEDARELGSSHALLSRISRMRRHDRGTATDEGDVRHGGR